MTSTAWIIPPDLRFRQPCWMWLNILCNMDPPGNLHKKLPTGEPGDSSVPRRNLHKIRSPSNFLLEEIPNNHLGCITPCKLWDKLPTSTVRCETRTFIIVSVSLSHRAFHSSCWGVISMAPRIPNDKRKTRGLKAMKTWRKKLYILLSLQCLYLEREREMCIYVNRYPTQNFDDVGPPI